MKSSARTVFRLTTRLTAAAAAVVLVRPELLSGTSLAGTGIFEKLITRASGSFRPEAVFPAVSPFITFMSAAASRSVSLLFVLAIPVFLLSFLPGRVFCRYICPVGLGTELAGRTRGKSLVLKRFPRIGRWILAVAAGGAVVGCPILLWTDPLAILTSFVNAPFKPFTAASIAATAGLSAVMLLSLAVPGAWCFRTCPLGALQGLLRNAWIFIRLRVSESREKTNSMDRRFALVGLGGLILGAVLRKAGASRTPLIRPPGAGNEGRLSGLCARCGNCARACPEKIIYPDMAGLVSFMTPMIKMGMRTYCSETCNTCGRVCPTGAIRKMSLETKLTVRIGTAEIIKPDCLAWGRNENCRACADYCPYAAIDMKGSSRAPVPVVNSNMCNGCGLCQTVCPAEKLAVIVRPAAQKLLPEHPRKPLDSKGFPDLI